MESESPSIRYPFCSAEAEQAVSSATVANQDLGFDNDISDLLKDNFGPIDEGSERREENQFIEDFDNNLPILVEIFEDLKKIANIESQNKSKKGNTSDNEKSIDKDSETVGPPKKTVLDIQSEIELRNELDRVEKLRKPKFQTLPACDKRAKQEAQWREAVREAKKVSTLLPNNDFINHYPAKDLSMSSDLSSLDLDVDLDDTNSTSTQSVQTVPIVKSTLMVNTKKHLSAANHFPANSRIFNRSLEQLQCQADAISSAYLSAAASKLQNQSHKGIKRLHKTANITKYLQEGNNNRVQYIDRNPFGITRSVDNVYESSWNIKNEAAGINNQEKLNGGNPEIFVDFLTVSSTNDAMINNNSNPIYLRHAGINPVNQFLPSPDDVSTTYLANFGAGSVMPLAVPGPGSDIVTTLSPTIIAAQPVIPTHQVLQKFSKTIDASKPVLGHNSASIFNNSNHVNTVIQNIPSVPSRAKVQLSHSLSQNSRNVKTGSNNILTLNLPTLTSCFNCQKLSKVLPYLAHNRRKEAMACRKVIRTPMFLLCEMCGCKVRETVIFGDHMKLDHVSSAHLPFFLTNNRCKEMWQEQEGSQNCIEQGE